ncbi:hypothetical protein WH95_17450 [Kiloniella litopenaei]|uniref:Phage shock protein PspC N-terminal domain-containing protein n=1 Tax=Kiloniella litopenaei TaxID=1549748 RepID=A0A0M2R7W3_9PROT|nr:hypothetical protein [Kiloniella litopenaei]KKJ75618.1 hypothetical protein WH95_17450 [Kiloniella litopenaei]
MHNHRQKPGCHSYQAHHHQGAIKRVTRALADRFGVPRKLVLAAFIIGLFINFVLTLIVFFLSLYWVNNPGRLEGKFNKMADKTRHWMSGANSSRTRTQYAYAGTHKTPPPSDSEVDLDFSELCREFEDLERRTADMEKHVSSEEYKLNKEFQKMKKDNDG